MFELIALIVAYLFLVFVVLRSGEFRFSSQHFYVLFFLTIYVLGQLIAIDFNANDVLVESYYVGDVREIVSNGAIYYFYLIVIYGVIAAMTPTSFFEKSEGSYLNKFPLNLKRARIFGVVLSIVCFIALIILLNSAGRGFVESILSPQKVYFESEGSSSLYTSNGYLSLAASVSIFYAYMVICAFRVSGFDMNTIDKIIVSALIFVYVIFCFTTSSRGNIVNMIMILYSIYSFTGYSIPKRYVAFVLTCVVLIFSYMTSIRLDISFYDAAVSFFNTVFLYAGGASIFNTAMILEYFPPEKLYLGSSYLWIITAPIPRSIWSEKPLTALDEVVAREVYGHFDDAMHTTPPGYIGELIMNFGYAGSIIFGAIMIFLICKFVQNMSIRAGKGNFMPFVLYCSFLSRFVYMCFASSFNAAFINTLTGIAMVYIFYFIIRNKDGVYFQQGWY